MTKAPLSDLRILDFSDGVAGQYAGRMFAGFGATVTLVERAGGTTTRTLAPHKTLESGRRWSLLFEHLNGAKDSFELSDDPEVRADLHTMVAAADVVIRDEGSVDVPTIDARVIDCVIREFPEHGAYSRWRATEMVHYALSGTMYQTGRTDGHPLYGVGHRSAYAAGTTAFVSAMAALRERDRSGLGQRVDTSVFESVAAMAENIVSMYSYSKAQPLRRPVDFLATLPCADGWVMLYALTFWHLVCEVFDLPDLANDERFVELGPRILNWDAAVGILSERSVEFAADDVVARCQERRILCERAATVEALTDSTVWHERRMSVTFPKTDPTVTDGSPATHALGPLFRIDGGGWTTGRAPVLGARSSKTAGSESAVSKTTAPKELPAGVDAEPAQGSADLPLAGLRVVDMTTAWSGPFATRALAYLGAEVIKIESPARLDTWRGWYLPDMSPLFPNWEAGEHRYNRCVSFNTQGHDKRSFGFDVTKPGAREVFLELLARADVLVANFSSGVLDRLGFAYETLRESHPDLIVVEMPAFGAGTTSSGHVAMGSTMEAAAGMAALIGYGDGQPFHTGSTIVDPTGGLNGAAAALVALHGRARHGGGCHVEVAQTEVASHWIGEYVLAHLEGEPMPPPRGNEVVYAEPHEAFPCVGNDEWVAISVPDDDAWRGLCATLHRSELLDDPRFADPEARRRHRDELAEIITSWTRHQVKLDAANCLQSNGVPAAPVNRAVEVFFDPTLRENGFMIDLDLPEVGPATYPSLAYHLSRTPGRVRRRAPLFGEDNRWVLTELLRCSPEQVAALYESNAVSDTP